jgi:hypothetical protein
MADEIEKLVKDTDVAIAALAKSVSSIVGDPDLDDDETALALVESLEQYQKHMHELIPAGFTKAITAAVEVAKVKSTAAVAPKERKTEMDMNKLDDIKKLARDIDAGHIGNFASKHQWYTALQKASEADRKPHETKEQAFARYSTEADGRAMWKAMKGAAGHDFIPTAPEPVVMKNDANDTIRKLADQEMAADTSLTKLAALLKVHAEYPELVARAKAA